MVVGSRCSGTTCLNMPPFKGGGYFSFWKSNRFGRFLEIVQQSIQFKYFMFKICFF